MLSDGDGNMIVCMHVRGMHIDVNKTGLVERLNGLVLVCAQG